MFKKTTNLVSWGTPYNESTSLVLNKVTRHGVNNPMFSSTFTRILRVSLKFPLFGGPIFAFLILVHSALALDWDFHTFFVNNFHLSE